MQRLPQATFARWQWLLSLPMVTALACGLALLGWVVSLAGMLPPKSFTGFFGNGAAADSAPTEPPAPKQRGVPDGDGAGTEAGSVPPGDPFAASGIYGTEPAAGPGAPAADKPHVASEPANAPDIPQRDLPKELADVAARLKEKEKRLAARGRELDAEQEVLTKLRDDLDTEIGRLEQLKKEIAGLLDKVSADEQARLAKLVAIYEAMKPKQAAAIFDRLDLPVLLKVARRMRETKLAPILARMDPARARQVTSALSAAPKLPKLE